MVIFSRVTSNSSNLSSPFAKDRQVNHRVGGTKHLGARHFRIDAGHILAVNGDDLVAGQKSRAFGGRTGDGAGDGQVFGGGIHIRADAFIFACKARVGIRKILGIHVRGMLVAEGIHHAADRAAHECDVVHGLVYIIIMDKIPRFPERRRRVSGIPRVWPIAGREMWWAAQV